MKKRYGLETIIGKNSTLRFPRLITIEHTATINCILPANSEEIDSSFNTALTMQNADPEEACEQFDNISCSFAENFPIRVKIVIEGSVVSTEVLDPTIFSLMNIAFDMEGQDIESFRASVYDTLTAVTNFALIKLAPKKNFFLSDLINNTRTIVNNIVSYNCKRKKYKLSDVTHLNSRFKRYLLNTKDHVNNRYYHKRLLHNCFKTFKRGDHHLFKIIFDLIEYYETFLEDWEDLYDIVWDDQEINLLDDLLEHLLLAEEFKNLNICLDSKILTPITFLQQQSLKDKIVSLNSNSVSGLLEAIKMEYYHE